MRLLFVHQYFGAFGGAETNIFVTARELQRRGHCLGLLHAECTGKEEALWSSVFAERFTMDKANARRQTQAALDAFQPDLVTVHKMADLDVLESLLESHLPSARVVHDHDLYCMRSYKYNYFTRKICTRALSPYCVFPCGAVIARNREGRMPIRWESYRAKKREVALNQQFDHVIAYSQYTRNELIQNNFPAENISVFVPLRQRNNDTLSSFSERNLILFVGQIIRGKGVDVLIRALARLRVPFECRIVGDGNHRSYCERLARRFNLSDRVQFTGFLSQPELESLYREATLLAVSSVWPEPFGQVGPEAMQYGLPVVAFNAGGIREWLIHGFNGYLVPWMDMEQFAARIQQLLENKEQARDLGKNGLHFIAHRYDLDRHIAGLEKTFNHVITQSKNKNHEYSCHSAVGIC